MSYSVLIIIAIIVILGGVVVHSIYVVESPRAQWRFDGNGLDSSGDHDSILTNSKFVEGKLGKSLYLDEGTYAVVKDNPVVRLQGSFTITILVKNEKISPVAGIAGRLYGDSNGGFHIFNNNGDLYFKRDNQNILITRFDNTSDYRLLVITYDGKQVRGYFDGMLIKTEQVTFTTPTTAGDLFIGQPPGTGKFIGYVDDLRIYDEPLTPLDIFIMYLLFSFQ